MSPGISTAPTILASRHPAVSRPENLDQAGSCHHLRDFGCVWAGDRQDAYWLDWLQDKPFTTLFVDGNHENFDLLSRYPGGALAGRARPPAAPVGDPPDARAGVRHRRHALLHPWAAPPPTTERPGGEGRSWWPEELPAGRRLSEALANLDAAGWRVDTVLTHCASEAPRSPSPLV